MFLIILPLIFHHELELVENRFQKFPPAAGLRQKNGGKPSSKKRGKTLPETPPNNSHRTRTKTSISPGLRLVTPNPTHFPQRQNILPFSKKVAKVCPQTIFRSNSRQGLKKVQQFLWVFFKFCNISLNEYFLANLPWITGETTFRNGEFHKCPYCPNYKINQSQLHHAQISSSG